MAAPEFGTDRYPLRTLEIALPATLEPQGAICAVVILAGVAGRLAAVRDALGRNLFDLPVSAERTLLAAWCERFGRSFGEAVRVPVQLAIDDGSLKPLSEPLVPGVHIRASRDTESTRGTAGILRDLTVKFAEKGDVLVVQASDLAWEWTLSEAAEILASQAEIVLSADRDLRPAGFMRVRCALLRRVSSIGFVDLKEQFLTRCSSLCDFHIVKSRRQQSGSLHSREAYLAMVGLGSEPGGDGGTQANARPWNAERVIVEPGAEVDGTAILFNSVVLAGAKIGPRAVIVRSVIGKGASVPAGTEIVDRVLVGPSRARRHTHDVTW